MAKVTASSPIQLSEQLYDGTFTHWDGNLEISGLEPV